MKSQRGIGLFGLVFAILFVGAATIAGFKVGRPYLDASTMRGIVIKALNEASNEPDITERDLLLRIFDRENIQTLGIPADDIKVSRPNLGVAQFEVHVQMTTKIPLWKDASILLELEIDEASTK